MIYSFNVVLIFCGWNFLSMRTPQCVRKMSWRFIMELPKKTQNIVHVFILVHSFSWYLKCILLIKLRLKKSFGCKYHTSLYLLFTIFFYTFIAHRNQRIRHTFINYTLVDNFSFPFIQLLLINLIHDYK